jgi:histidinol phosphatase-like enzyme (inositol monophosphatase family)
MTETEIPLAELEGFALELAHLAGNIAQAHFRRPMTIRNKDEAGFDPVTNADRAIEKVIRMTILNRYPDHGVVGEEEGDTVSVSPYTWYIDPIDGTRSFMMGSPLWGTLVGLSYYDKPLFGLLSQPVLEEIFFGAPNGSWLIRPDGRQRLHGRDCVELGDAVLASTHPGLFDEQTRPAFEALADACLLDRFGGDCYNYAMMAAGFVDLVVEDGLHPYDIVPLIPILEGASCIVTDWEGRPPLLGGRAVAACTRELHEKALELLQKSM